MALPEQLADLVLASDGQECNENLARKQKKRLLSWSLVLGGFDRTNCQYSTAGPKKSWHHNPEDGKIVLTPCLEELYRNCFPKS